MPEKPVKKEKRKVKEGHVINLQTGSKKKGDKEVVPYEGGKLIELTEAQAASHASELEPLKSDKMA